eukprot:4025095-Amphidinium_carterae.1
MMYTQVFKHTLQKWSYHQVLPPILVEESFNQRETTGTRVCQPNAFLNFAFLAVSSGSLGLYACFSVSQKSAERRERATVLQKMLQNWLDMSS